jgi:hypothetical protein
LVDQSGLWIAIILTGFTMSYFVAWVGVSNLLWLGAFSMILSLLSLYFILNHGATLRAPEAPRRQQSRPIRPYQNRYLASYLPWSSSGGIAFFFRYALYDRANAQFPDGNQLAGFIGNFLGFLGIFTWTLNTFFSGPVINKFGQRVTLLILPVLLFAGTAILVLIANLNPSVALLFYFMTSIKLVDLGIGFSLDRTALTVLYQPLALNIRSRLQTVAEGIVQPIAIGVAGVMLIALGRYFKLETNQLYIVLLLLTIGWIIIAFSLGREYPRMILKALDKRILRGEDSLIYDPSMVQYLQKGLQSTHPGVVIYSLNVLESLDYPQIAQAYSQLVNHPSEEVRVEVLERIENHRIKETIPSIKMHLSEFTGATRGQAVQTIASLGSKHSWQS